MTMMTAMTMTTMSMARRREWRGRGREGACPLPFLSSPSFRLLVFLASHSSFLRAFLHRLLASCCVDVSSLPYRLIWRGEEEGDGDRSFPSFGQPFLLLCLASFAFTPPVSSFSVLLSAFGGRRGRDTGNEGEEASEKEREGAFPLAPGMMLVFLFPSFSAPTNDDGGGGGLPWPSPPPLAVLASPWMPLVFFLAVTSRSSSFLSSSSSPFLS